MKLAFESAFAGELKVKSSDLKHFQEFNITYIGIILSSYRPYRSEHLKIYNDNRRTTLQKLEREKEKQSPQKTDKKRLYEGLVKYIEKHKKYPWWDYNSAFDYLIETGKISITEDQEQAFKQEIKDRNNPEKKKSVKILTQLDRLASQEYKKWYLQTKYLPKIYSFL